MTVLEYIFAALGLTITVMFAYCAIKTICLIIYLGIKHLPKEDSNE